MSLRRLFAPACLALLFILPARATTPENPAAALPDAPENAPASYSYTATPLMADETRVVIQLLETVHYLNTPVSNATFEKLITQFMSDLDDQRLIFSAADEQQFLADFGPTLGKTLREKGTLDAAFRIYGTYRERADARVSWIVEELKKDIDFTAQETYALDRDKADWPASIEQADDLWRRRLKFELLPDLLDGKSIDEAKQAVARRYERMRKNLADIDEPDIEEMFLSTLTRLYDPHSTFFSAETLEDFSIQMRLSLIGIGALLASEDGYCVIKELIPGGPAMLSKSIQLNDKIVAVAEDGEEPVDVIGMNLRKVVKMIRGKKGSTVALTVVPASDPAQRRQVALVRDVVQLNASRARASIQDVPVNDHATMPIGVIDVPSFYGPVDDGEAEEASSSSVTSDVEELIGKLEAAGVRGIVLDLRRNGGGLLGEAVALTGLFIPKGPVVQVRDSFGQVSVRPDVDPRIAYDGPLMVLTSRFSASASEIVAGALQNYGRAIIVGDSSTHGKGTVQAVLEMDKFIPRQVLTTGRRGAAKLTIQKFYLPNGASTQNKGVLPDVSLPAIEDFLPIGEADLPNSLSWDTIPAVRFNGRQLDVGLRDHLREGAQARVQSLDEFSYLGQRIAWFKVREELKEISLNLETRRAMKDEEERFRTKMTTAQTTLSALNFGHRDVLLDSVTRDEAATATVDDLAVPDGGEDETEGFDVHLRESLRILRDAIDIAPNPHEWTESGALVAALSAHQPDVEPARN